MRLQLKWPSQLAFHILLCTIATLFGASNPRMANASFLAKRILVTVRCRARCYVSHHRWRENKCARLPCCSNAAQMLVKVLSLLINIKRRSAGSVSPPGGIERAADVSDCVYQSLNDDMS